MRKTLLSLITVWCGSLLFAQTTITNGGFETWQNESQPTEEPTQWNSNKTGGNNAPSGPQTCFKETSNPHSGTACARVKTGLAFGIVVVNGSLTTGKVEAPTTNKADGYIRTIPTDPNYGMSFTGRPDSLVFWYRYDSYSSDYPRVEARLHVGYAYAPEAPSNNNHPDSTVNIIARAQWTNVPNSDVSTWTRVSMPFVYVDSRTPQYILITTTSSGNQTGGTNNSTLWLDDFEAIYNPTIATCQASSAIACGVQSARSPTAQALAKSGCGQTGKQSAPSASTTAQPPALRRPQTCWCSATRAMNSSSRALAGRRMMRWNSAWSRA